jgi:hypothetical protein
LRKYSERELFKCDLKGKNTRFFELSDILSDLKKLIPENSELDSIKNNQYNHNNYLSLQTLSPILAI